MKKKVFMYSFSSMQQSRPPHKAASSNPLFGVLIKNLQSAATPCQERRNPLYIIGLVHAHHCNAPQSRHTMLQLCLHATAQKGYQCRCQYQCQSDTPIHASREKHTKSNSKRKGCMPIPMLRRSQGRLQRQKTDGRQVFS